MKNTDIEAWNSGFIARNLKNRLARSYFELIKNFLKNKKLLSVLEFSKLKQVLMNKVLEFDGNLLNKTYFQTQWTSCNAAISDIRSPGRFSMSFGLPLTLKTV